MANAFESRVQVTGIEDLVLKAKALPPRLERKLWRKAFRAGAGVIRDSARSKVRVDTGSLKKLLVVAEGDPRKNGGSIVMSVGVAKGSFIAIRTPRGTSYKRLKKGAIKGTPNRITPSRYFHLVENGTLPHALGNGKTHPGSRPNPALRPALDEKSGAAFSTIKTIARAEFDRIVEEA